MRIGFISVKVPRIFLFSVSMIMGQTNGPRKGSRITSNTKDPCWLVSHETNQHDYLFFSI